MPDPAVRIRSVERSEDAFASLDSSSLAELPVEEVSGGDVRLDPARVNQDVVDLVGEDELLEGHALPPQRLGEVHALAEGHVAVVVAMDQEDRRPPRLHGCER